MEIFYTSHAVNRMQIRNVSAAEVESVITDPMGVIPQTKDKQIFFRRLPRRSDNLIAIVALARRDDQYEIITVMNFFEVRK